jgi:EmrB/QacA subfamily drug resistance transporter
MLVFGGTMLAMMLAALDQTIVATALPTIALDLHGIQHYAWVADAYLLTSTVTVPLYGKLSDMFGRRMLFLVSISIFLVGSALCGLSQSMTQLIAFRALQGFGAGGILPLAQATIGDLFSARDRGRYAGYTGAVFASASIIGPLVGGWLTDSVSWRWIFYINLPLGAAALFVIGTRMHLPFHKREHRVDYLGAAVLTFSVVCLLMVAIWGGVTYPWMSGQIIGLAIAGVIGLVTFIAVERRAAEPIIPLGLFRDSIFNVTAGTAFLFGVAMFGAIFFIPLFMQQVVGVSATNSGIVIMPLMLGWVATSVVAGQIVSRTGRYKLLPIVGSFVVVFGFFLLTRLGVHSTQTTAIVDMVVLGLGMGMVFQIYLVAMQNSIQPKDMGSATATVQFFRSMGATFGVAAFGTIFFTRLTSQLMERIGPAVQHLDLNRLVNSPAGSTHVPPAIANDLRLSLSSALHDVFVGTMFVAVIALVFAFLLKEKPLRTTSNVSAALSSEVGPVAEEGTQQAAQATHERAPATRSSSG